VSSRRFRRNSVLSRCMARSLRRIRPLLGASRSAIKATTIAMVMGTGTKVNQKHRISVLVHLNKKKPPNR
jgi:hypothetical protein